MPHPVRTPARFRLTTPEAQPVQVEEYDLPLRTDRLAGGVYFLRITGEDFTTTERVTVVR